MSTCSRFGETSLGRLVARVPRHIVLNTIEGIRDFCEPASEAYRRHRALRTWISSLLALLVIMAIDALFNHPAAMLIAYAAPLSYATQRSGKMTGFALLPLVMLVAFVHQASLPAMGTDRIILESIVMLTVFVGVILVTDATESKLRTVQYQALHDPLTGALNRLGFDMKADKIWDEAMENDSVISLAVIDANDFKALNDKHGHEAGDTALMHLSHAIARWVGPSALISRMGGDEFMVLAPRYAKHVLEDRLQKAQESYRSITHTYGFESSFSYGTAQFGVDGNSMYEMRSKADADMYRQKAIHAQNGLQRRRSLDIRLG